VLYSTASIEKKYFSCSAADEKKVEVRLAQEEFVHTVIFPGY